MNRLYQSICGSVLVSILRGASHDSQLHGYRRRRTLRSSGLLFAMAWAFALPLQAAKINVFLVGGQSNADGRAGSSRLPAELQAPQSDVAIYWATARNGSSTLNASGYEPLRPGLSNSSGSFGPEVTFGRAMADFYAARGEQVALIKHAQGGTGLVTEWQAGGDATTNGDGFVYRLFQDVVNTGLASIEAAHPPGGAPPMEVSIAGMIWMQGERDSNSTRDALAYESNLTQFIGDVRSTYGTDLPFVIGQLSMNQTGTNGTADARETVRIAQADVAEALANTALVVTNDFGLKTDNLHFDAAGQQDLGYAFANKMQSLIVPEPTSIALIGIMGLLVPRRETVRKPQKLIADKHV